MSAAIGTSVGSLLAFSSLLGLGSTQTQKQDPVTIVSLDRPDTTRGNEFYPGNRPPLLPSVLIKLPVGSIRPEGWLRHQLECMADGFTGHLTEISEFCRFEDSAWASPDGRGKRGWEELPYWLKGFGDLGIVLENERIIHEANRWLEAILSSQRPDGSFGPRANYEQPDLWPNMIALYALRSHHEATADPRVLPFMARYFRWQMTVPLDKLYPGSWQKWRAADNLDSIHWLYNRTGESWLLEAARVNHERTADWSGGMPTWHGVNIGQCFRGPAQYYQQTHDRRYLEATERVYKTVMEQYGQVPGGLFGADENCRPGYTGPRQGTETCTMAEIMFSHQILTAITGDAIWADRCEEVTFNSLPAAMTPDLKALHYLTAPNMIQLDCRNKSPLVENVGDMLSYNPWLYRCCQHNVAFAWPYFAEHLWMATPGNGLAAVLYAASTVKARVGDGTVVTITETTDYPFRSLVELKLTAARPVQFPLYLRIPGWCEAAKVHVNGEPLAGQTGPRSWVVLTRTWKDGDAVRLELAMNTGVRVWTKNRNAVSVHRGPLAYSLKIGERWVAYGDSKKWPGYEVFPTTPWNYGLIADPQNPAASFTVVESGDPLPNQPFTPDAAPVRLLAKGKRIPQWTQEENDLIGEIQPSPIRSEEPVEDITLVPMGCARLRVSAFPWIGEGPDAKPWLEAALLSPVVVTASHVHDTLAGLNDGVQPASSSDETVPRFTWLDRRGSAEWVQYTFFAPRRISWCEVYWYDHPAKSSCRVPATWKVLYHDGRAWQPVSNASEFGTAKDRYNRATFDAVTTRQVRLWAELQPEFSGGILKWRIGE